MNRTDSGVALQASILAALVGTFFMTLSSASEADWTQRGDSPAPATALLFPLEKMFGLNVEGRLLYVIAVPAHWLIGTSWGIVW